MTDLQPTPEMIGVLLALVAVMIARHPTWSLSDKGVALSVLALVAVLAL